MTQGAQAVAPGGVHGIPAALTSFVGRAGEAAELAELLADYRLVTVTGPGGVGKTRLVAEVAWQVSGRFADGVWLVELASVPDPAEVSAAVARALELQFPPGATVADSMPGVLARRQLLLVLDNCEHVLAGAADLCAAVLPAADDVRVLATSRQPLGVDGESCYRLAPLGLPRTADPADPAVSEAVRLFADRARRADPHFALSPESAGAVAGLVARLDGMPLAIELAAARVEALSLTELASHLDEWLRLLTAKGRRAAGRHRSLAAAAEWSYRLLDKAAQQVFRQLSVFPAPFTLAAAEAVAGPDAGAAVLHLVDCSLLVPPRIGADGRPRYLMLDTLRSYAAERLAEASEQPDTAARLARYAAAVAEQAAAEMAACTGELAAARWLDAEEPTMQQTLTWALEHDSATALRLAIALAPWWRLRGRSVAGYGLLLQAAGPADIGSPAWCAAQFLLGQAAVSTGNTTAALDHFTAVVDSSTGRETLLVLADCRSGRAHSMMNLGQIREGAEEAARALVLAKEIGYGPGEALALLELGLAASYDGDAGNALAWARQAQRIDQAGLPGWIARLSNTYLTLFMTAAGDLAAAQSSCAAGLAMARQTGSLQDQADCLELMTDLDRQLGHTADAGAHLREALELASRIGSRGHLIDCLELCAHLCAATGRSAEALTLWAARSARLQDAGMPDAPRDVDRRQEPLRKARQTLGPDLARAAEERGAVLTLATAAELALMLAASAAADQRGQQQPRRPAAMLQLSAREEQLITLVAQGRTNTQIAGQLFISVRTVGSHLDRIRDKTGCRRRADLTRLALQAGLV